jgi:hypothetical protein
VNPLPAGAREAVLQKTIFLSYRGVAASLQKGRPTRWYLQTAIRGERPGILIGQYKADKGTGKSGQTQTSTADFL